MTPPKKLVIVGNTAFAEIACEYFSHDSDYEVVAFTVERPWLKEPALMDRPVVAFEDLERHFSPADHSVYVAATYTQLNRLRERLLNQARAKGYAPASYVSSRAFVWRNVKLGEHCFIFEDNTVQPFVTIGDDVVLWSGNHIGHHSHVGDHCFISSHVVVSGFCDIGSHSFLGVNATIANNVSIGADNWISPNVAIMKSTAENSLYKASRSEPAAIGARAFFKLEP